MNGTTLVPLGTKLLPLADNGGPTPTMALGLGLGSPALDAGNSNCQSILGIDQVSWDQRLMTRIDQDGNNDGVSNFCDIGAFETFSRGCETQPIHISEYTYNGPAQDNILSQTTITTVGNVVVGPASNVYFAASNGIDLSSGFSVQKGGVFLAEVKSVSCP
ncbi:MAG: hypothetical protein L3J24_11915 [Xanthomonadales bacterium]|nr:hypothetical protein [Xanthomonadales bacterium]